MTMELRQLRYFVAVADTLSFTKAARQLHLSQPPISRQVLKLEHEIGVELLRRSQHRVELTAAGRAFHEQARAVLAMAQRAVRTAQRAEQGQSGQLTLGFGGMAAYLLPPALAAFRDRYPDVELALSPLNLAYHLQALKEERIDLGLVVLPVEDETIATQRFERIPLVVAMPEGHPLAARRSLPLRQLAGFGFVMLPWARAHGFGRVIVRACSRAGFMPQVTQEAEPMESVIGMVGAGVGIAIVPSTVQTLPVGRVVYRPIEEPYAVADVALAWNRANASPVLRNFLALARPAPAGRRRTGGR